MVQLRAVVPAAVPVESVTLAVKTNGPAALGVPLMAPFPAFSDSPPGRPPEMMEKMSGGTPPVDPSAEMYGTPT